MQNLDYACMQIVSQGQRNKLYKHVHVKLTVKLKRLEGVSFTDYYR